MISCIRNFVKNCQERSKNGGNGKEDGMSGGGGFFLRRRGKGVDMTKGRTKEVGLKMTDTSTVAAGRVAND